MRTRRKREGGLFCKLRFCCEELLPHLGNWASSQMEYFLGMLLCLLRQLPGWRNLWLWQCETAKSLYFVSFLGCIPWPPSQGKSREENDRKPLHSGLFCLYLMTSLRGLMNNRSWVYMDIVTHRNPTMMMIFGTIKGWGAYLTVACLYLTTWRLWLKFMWQPESKRPTAAATPSISNPKYVS